MDFSLSLCSISIPCCDSGNVEPHSQALSAPELFFSVERWGGAGLWARKPQIGVVVVLQGWYFSDCTKLFCFSSKIRQPEPDFCCPKFTSTADPCIHPGWNRIPLGYFHFPFLLVCLFVFLFVLVVSLFLGVFGFLRFFLFVCLLAFFFFPFILSFFNTPCPE